MTEEELLAQFPALHAALLAKGQTKERDRVVAHLNMAKAYSATAVAHAHIISGKSLSEDVVLSEYLAAGAARFETVARQTDSDEAGKVLDGAAPAAEGGKDLGDEVADRVEAHLGKTKKAS